MKRILITITSILCISGAAFAGPAPKYIVIDGTIMKLVPMTSDVMLSNGCKLCMNGMMVSKKGKATKLADGTMITSSGKMMSPSANHAHGG